MPEAEALGSKPAESRRNGRRPAIGADCCSAKPLRCRPQSIRLGLVECRHEKKCACIRIEIPEPRGEGSLEPRRQRKRLESGRWFELEPACHDRELGQC
jgi:hypothetical protein